MVLPTKLPDTSPRATDPADTEIVTITLGTVQFWVVVTVNVA